MSAHYFKGFEINKEQEKLFRRNIKTMFYLFAAHTLLVFYSAFFMSKQAWAFISGGLFYILFAVFFIVELLKNIILRRKFKKEELLSEIDAEGKLIGVMTRTEAHDGSKRMHPVIHVHILNSKGELLLQKRNKNKFIQPGKWDTAVGGHISHGEKIEIALERETYEELGLRNLKYQYITKYIWESEIEKEMVFVFLAQHEEFDFIKNNEVDEVKFWSFKQIKNNLSKNIFTPNFEIDFVNILSKIKK